MVNAMVALYKISGQQRVLTIPYISDKYKSFLWGIFAAIQEDKKNKNMLPVRKVTEEEIVMAEKLTAINLLRPKLKMGRMITMEKVDPYVAARTSLNRGGISHVLKELHDAIIFFARDGRSVKIDGLGRFVPKIALNGTISLGIRLDPELRRRINDSGKYEGEIVNRDNIGKSPDELVALWNEEHPEDPVVE
jgi:hypothetical protein